MMDSVYTWALREVKDEIVELTMLMCQFHFISNYFKPFHLKLFWYMMTGMMADIIAIFKTGSRETEGNHTSVAQNLNLTS